MEKSITTNFSQLCNCKIFILVSINILHVFKVFKHSQNVWNKKFALNKKASRFFYLSVHVDIGVNEAGDKELVELVVGRRAVVACSLKNRFQI